MNKWMAALVCGLVSAGCTKAPDFSGVELERAKPVQRTDNFQAAAGNGQALIGVGNGGVVVSSLDQGQSWSRATLSGPSSLIAATTCADGRFVALDFYRKLHVGDAQGKQFNQQALPDDVQPMSVACDLRGRIWVVGSFTTILWSDDGGASWDRQDLGEDAFLTTVQFLDAEHGVITGEFGALLQTADGGATWERAAPIPNDFYPYAAWFATPTEGWVSGIAGVILHTSDGGASWTEQTNESGAPMYALVNTGAQLVAVGAAGQVVALHDDRWQRVPGTPSVPAYLAAGASLSPDALLIAGAAGALKVMQLPSPSVAIQGQSLAAQ
jgi:photosystem II stability/assembly factor-like uncharacterized protein